MRAQARHTWTKADEPSRFSNLTRPTFSGLSTRKLQQTVASATATAQSNGGTSIVQVYGLMPFFFLMGVRSGLIGDCFVFQADAEAVSRGQPTIAVVNATGEAVPGTIVVTGAYT
jgi:hypothetical protein